MLFRYCSAAACSAAAVSARSVSAAAMLFARLSGSEGVSEGPQSTSTLIGSSSLDSSGGQCRWQLRREQDHANEFRRAWWLLVW